MRFVVIGGGAGGYATALELASTYPESEIIIVEKRNGLLEGSSDDTPCRLGLGFHYIDVDTAKKYLHATISLLKKYPGYVVAQDKEQSHPYRHWRYFIVEDSLFSIGQVDTVYAAIKAEYERLIKEDPANKVLGEPKNFYRLLKVKEYDKYVNTDKVTVGFETAEQVLNWPAFKADFIQEVKKHPNITIYQNTEVINAEHSSEQLGFCLTVKQNGVQTQKIQADFVINSSWESVEAINHKAGFYMPPDSRTNRLKVIVEIELPEDFEKEGPVNSMFFCFGPHCSFTNLGNGRGFVSYEPITNIETSTDLRLPPLSERLLYSKPSAEEMNEYGSKILAGVESYIPGLKGSKILGAKFGIVKTKGTVDINSPYSGVHCRNYSGVVAQQIGWIDNSLMKLLYLLDNADEVKKLVGEQIRVDKEIDSIASNLAANDFNENGKNSNSKCKTMAFMLCKNLQTWMTDSNIKDKDKITLQMRNTMFAKEKIANVIHEREITYPKKEMLKRC